MPELITYDTIRKAHRAEKQEIALQKLPDSFFLLVRGWLDHKQAIQKSAEAFLEIKNTKNLLEDLLNRREKKLVIAALHTIRGDLPPQNMTLDEEKLFDSFVRLLKQARQDFKEQMFGYDGIIEEKIESAKSLMEEMRGGENMQAFPQKETDVAKASGVEKTGAAESAKKNPLSNAAAATETKIIDNGVKTPEKTADSAAAQSGLAKLRITTDMPSFVDAEMKSYGPFKAGTTAELPKEVAQILIARKVAEAAGSL